MIFLDIVYSLFHVTFFAGGHGLALWAIWNQQSGWLFAAFLVTLLPSLDCLATPGIFWRIGVTNLLYLFILWERETGEYYLPVPIFPLQHPLFHRILRCARLEYVRQVGSQP